MTTLSEQTRPFRRGPVARTAGGAFLATLVAGKPAAPIYLQIYRTLRKAILNGQMPQGIRLPSTRTLASDLAVSRHTTEEAFAQLLAEGFIERRVGDGTYVAAMERAVAPHPANKKVGTNGSRRLSERASLMARHACFPDPAKPRAFTAASPAVELFPLETWRRLVATCLRRSGSRVLGTGDPAGYGPLREAIASYVGASRNVVCGPEQVIVVTSSQQALDLAARVLLDPGDPAWLEDPGYPGARAALLTNGAHIVPVPIDEAGLRVDEGERLARNARLAYVTPSHQYPLGVTLSLERRLALLNWAGRQGAWVVEDDYDSEFRYDGRPLAAIQGIDEGDRVIYVGTFTKVMFPALRLAYAIVPRDLVASFVTARGLVDGHPPTLSQMALTEFFADGHFGVHIRRMRELYRGRRDALVEAWERHNTSSARLGPADAGLHVVAHLPRGTDDSLASARVARRGIDAQPLARYFHGPLSQRGLFLGYAALSPAEIRAGIKSLCEALQ
jgi:GntR family transcriptional regulator / MocR family aminotransferase